MNGPGYATATALEAASRETASGATVLAGGTTLLDLMKTGALRPARLLDINALPDPALRRIETEGTTLRFGALVRMAELADHPVIRRDYPMLSESLWRGASQQIRNMASLGGNLLQRTRCAHFRDPGSACNRRVPGSGCPAIGGSDRLHAVLGGSEACIAAYPGDWAPALVALDAELDLVAPGGARRSLPVEALHREPGTTPERETNLAPGELIAAIRIPATDLGRASTYVKLRDRDSYEFAAAGAAVALRVAGGVVREARIGLGNLATRPWRARAAEAFLAGRRPDAETAAEAGRIALSGAQAGHHNGFRIALGAAAVARAIGIAAERASA